MSGASVARGSAREPNPLVTSPGRGGSRRCPCRCAGWRSRRRVRASHRGLVVPTVAVAIEHQFQGAVVLVGASLEVGRAVVERVKRLAAGSDREFANAVVRVGVPGRIHRGEARVNVVVAVEDEIRVVGVQKLPPHVRGWSLRVTALRDGQAARRVSPAEGRLAPVGQRGSRMVVLEILGEPLDLALVPGRVRVAVAVRGGVALGAAWCLRSPRASSLTRGQNQSSRDFGRSGCSSPSMTSVPATRRSAAFSGFRSTSSSSIAP